MEKDLFGLYPRKDDAARVALTPTNAYPQNHRHVREGLQIWLRLFAFLSVLGGVITGLWVASIEAPDASQAGTAYLLMATSIGSGVVMCLALLTAAAIVDALRVIASASFKAPTLTPGAQTPPGPMR